jgi:hypothetical protein
MIHEIHGVVDHIPSKTTDNKFLIVGRHYVEGLARPGDGLLRFRLVDEAHVDHVVELLPRVHLAEAEWKHDALTGILRLRLNQPKNAKEADADAAASGGPARTIRLKDLLRDLAKDPEITQSQGGQTRQPEAGPDMPKPAAKPRVLSAPDLNRFVRRAPAGEIER